MRRLPPAFIAALIALGAVVTADVVPGVFSVDDNNYLVNVVALRQGRVTIPQTDGLPPSPELLFFDPGPWSRQVTSTPVASTAPPLYAPIALPFSFFGWRGLVFLNTLSYLATTLMVFVFVRRHATQEQSAWLAAAAFALGGFSIEYAEGVWPHMLSVALVTGGILAAGRAISDENLRTAALSGILLGMAAGIRYQNAVVLASVAVGTLVLGRFRMKTLAVLVLAAALPIAASSAIDHARLGSWNPISKGPGYLSTSAGSGSSPSVTDPLVMFWARLVDYSQRPPLRSPTFSSWQTYDEATGAHLMLGMVLKKAVVQSAPWVSVALGVVALAWIRPRLIGHIPAIEVRLFGLVGAALFGVFSLAGVAQGRRLQLQPAIPLEIVPLCAMAFGCALDHVAVRWRAAALGAGIAGLSVLAILLLAGGPGHPNWGFSNLLLLKVPLGLAAALLGVWALTWRRAQMAVLSSAIVGAALGWAIILHLAQDLPASHRTRMYNLERTAALAQILQDGSVLVAHWWMKDPAVPLLLDRNVLILDTRADGGRDAPRLIRGLLSQKRHVVLLPEAMPIDVRDRVVSGLATMPVRSGALDLLEVGLPPNQ